MPVKSNPAVSQLAGEIAEKLFNDMSGRKGFHAYGLDDDIVAEWKSKWAGLISAALSEREEKIAKLIEAVKDDICSAPCGPMCCGKLRAALSARGESKGINQ